MNVYQVEMRGFGSGVRWTDYVAAATANDAVDKAEEIFEAECLGAILDEDAAPITEDVEYGDGMTDAEADADTLRSAGMGTDEDYGYYGSDDDY